MERVRSRAVWHAFQHHLDPGLRNRRCAVTAVMDARPGVARPPATHSRESGQVDRAVAAAQTRAVWVYKPAHLHFPRA